MSPSEPAGDPNTVRYCFSGAGLPLDDPGVLVRQQKALRPWKAALGFDLDGTIDEAPDFFRELTRIWPGPLYVVTYRENKEKAEADVERSGIRNVEVVLVDSLQEKADVIQRLNIKVFFDDMDEVLMHIPEDVTVFKIRNGGNYCYQSRRWLYSQTTGKEL